MRALSIRENTDTQICGKGREAKEIKETEEWRKQENRKDYVHKTSMGYPYPP